ncbi:hypothetical protein P4O66_010149 [Electrophorus voltai]|uniref:Uncharacterized protein n=1 Tax=Electrophorus voltai TaxID=2609070 RepID=A0AAD8Z984_9TELE|nr:hypothetical protein P4O66_010149 [Electrophorus voltai]
MPAWTAYEIPKLGNKTKTREKLKGEMFNCSKEGFRVPKNVKQAPEQSPKEDRVNNQCEACSGMAEVRCECISTNSEAKAFGGWLGVKNGSKEATSLQEKHQGQTDILQKYRNWTAEDWGKVIFSDEAPSDCLGHLDK